ncbi:MAG: 30S ribosomal protein S3 [Candidatus Woesearchaeota archaeon]
MIERKFVAQNFKEFQIKEFVKKSLSRVGLSDVKLKRTSLGERVIVSASRPGLVVGRGGSNIQGLTKELKKRFELENPQIEIEEIKDFNSNAAVVAEMIVNQLERFGTRRFKGIGHKSVDAVMRAGALGVEILISGKIPSSRSKTWRFADGYMKKCGDLAITGVDTAVETANLKTGAVGVQVRIIPGNIRLPDQVEFSEQVAGSVEKEETPDQIAEDSSVEISESDEEVKADSETGKAENQKQTAKKSAKKASKKAAKKASKKSTKKTSKKAATKKQAAGDSEQGSENSTPETVKQTADKDSSGDEK